MKIRNTFLIVLGLIVLIFFGCANFAPIVRTKAFTKPEYSLDSYKYILILNSSDSYFETELEISKMFSSLGFFVLNEREVKKLDKSELNKLLYCKISYPFRWGDTGVTISLYDILQQRIFSISGERGNELYYPSKTDIVKKFYVELENIYSGYDSKKEINLTNYYNPETIEKSEENLKQYFNKNIASLNPIEGIWTEAKNNQYRIGIFKDDSSKNRDFVAIILKSNSIFWEPQQVKIELKKTAYNKVYSTTYYMSDHTEQGTTLHINDVGMLEMELKDNYGNFIIVNYIKNYPSDIDTKIGGKFDISSDKSESIGSGFFVSESGLVVTNYHVIEDKSIINVFLPTLNITFNAIVALKDKNNDIAILQLSDFIFSDIFSISIPFTISHSSKVRLGQEVFTLGFPLGEILGKSAKLSTGTINSLYGIQDDPRVFQISNPIQPGNSGGPLFNRNGELIGVVFSSLNAKFFYENADIIPQNVNFAIKSDYLLNLISMLPDESEIINRKNKLLGKSLETQIELLAPFIVNIKAK